MGVVRATAWEGECMEGNNESAPLLAPTDAFLGEIPVFAETEASCLGQMVDSECSLLNGVGFA